MNIDRSAGVSFPVRQSSRNLCHGLCSPYKLPSSSPCFPRALTASMIDRLLTIVNSTENLSVVAHRPYARSSRALDHLTANDAACTTQFIPTHAIAPSPNSAGLARQITPAATMPVIAISLTTALRLNSGGMSLDIAVTKSERYASNADLATSSTFPSPLAAAGASVPR